MGGISRTGSPTGQKPWFDRILIIDDDGFVREVLVAALEARGRRIRAVASAAEALAVVGEFRPTLVLLDFVMPGMDGPATWNALKAEMRTLPPVIFMSARNRSDIAGQLAALGATGLIEKPFNPLEVAGDIAHLLDAAMVHPREQASRLASVAEAFRRSLPETANQIERLRNDMRVHGWRNDVAELLLAKAHTLAGSAGLFDRTDLGIAASDAERLLLDLIKSGRVPGEAEIKKVISTAGNLAECCRART